MMNFTKKAGIIAATSLVFAATASATVFNATASFRTIADISIIEVAAVNFGTGVTGKAGTVCIVDSIITAATPALAVDAATLGAASTGCTLTGMVAGEYTITGAANATVTLLMATAVDTDFTFAPAGDYSDQTAAADNITTYFADAPTNVVLNGAGGTGMLSVGGTLNIINTLAASTSYSVPYDVSIVY